MLTVAVVAVIVVHDGDEGESESVDGIVAVDNVNFAVVDAVLTAVDCDDDGDDDVEVVVRFDDVWVEEVPNFLPNS